MRTRSAGVGSRALEWGGLLSLGIVYTLVRAWAAPSDGAVAVANALDVMALERALGLFVEGPVQAAALSHAWVVSFSNTYYLALHLPPVIGLLAYAFWRGGEHWPLVRNALATFTVLGLAIHVAYPVAPPWVVDATDVATTYGGDRTRELVASGLGNPFAAMPSMHLGWALAAGIGFVLLATNLWLRLFGVVHPAIMAAATVVTGNHYVLDLVASVVLLGLSFAAVSLVKRWSLPAARGERDPPRSARASSPER